MEDFNLYVTTFVFVTLISATRIFLHNSLRPNKKIIWNIRTGYGIFKSKYVIIV